MTIPEQARDLHNQARSLGEQGQYDQALMLLQEAMALAPQWAYPPYDMAFTHLLRGEFGLALTYYRKADALEPEGFFTTKTAVWALTKEEQGDFPRGLYRAYLQTEWTDDPAEKFEVLRGIVHHCPGFAPAWKELAALLDEPDAKRRALERGLACAPDLDPETQGMLRLNRALMLRYDEPAMAKEELLALSKPPATRATQLWAKRVLLEIAPTYPDPQEWEHATERQAQRAARSLAALEQRQVPVYPGPLMVSDDDETQLQESSEAARRVLVLWSVVLKAKGLLSEDEVARRLDVFGSSVSTHERRFLNSDEPDEDERQHIIWRLEAMWVLMWALGHVELPWPGSMCDVPALVGVVERHESNPDFVAQARLRPKAEFLDAQDLTMRLHWAIRNAHVYGSAVPANLDWSNPDAMVSPAESAAVGVIEQRHHTLNWLLCTGDDWDEVDTPT